MKWKDAGGPTQNGGRGGACSFQTRSNCIPPPAPALPFFIAAEVEHRWSLNQPSRSLLLFWPSPLTWISPSSHSFFGISFEAEPETVYRELLGESEHESSYLHSASAHERQHRSGDVKNHWTSPADFLSVSPTLVLSFWRLNISFKTTKYSMLWELVAVFSNIMYFSHYIVRLFAQNLLPDPFSIIFVCFIKF